MCKKYTELLNKTHKKPIYSSNFILSPSKLIANMLSPIQLCQHLSQSSIHFFCRLIRVWPQLTQNAFLNVVNLASETRRVTKGHINWVRSLVDDIRCFLPKTLAEWYLCAMVHYQDAKSINSPSTNLAVFGKCSSINAS